jgi:hypothetical protein
MGNPRQPAYLSLPEYSNNDDLLETNIEIYMSSCWFRSHWSFDKSKAYTFNLLGGRDGYFVCALPYQMAIKEGLKKRIEIEDEMSESDMEEKINDLEKKSDELQNKINQQQKKSDIAGNVRTGMFAVDTVSNVAGAVVSSKTIVDDDFVEQIKKCTESVAELRDARVRAKVEDGGMGLTQNMDISQKIIEKCGE